MLGAASAARSRVSGVRSTVSTGSSIGTETIPAGAAHAPARASPAPAGASAARVAPRDVEVQDAGERRPGEVRDEQQPGDDPHASERDGRHGDRDPEHDELREREPEPLRPEEDQGPAEVEQELDRERHQRRPHVRFAGELGADIAVAVVELGTAVKMLAVRLLGSPSATTRHDRCGDAHQQVERRPHGAEHPIGRVPARLVERPVPAPDVSGRQRADRSAGDDGRRDDCGVAHVEVDPRRPPANPVQQRHVDPSDRHRVQSSGFSPTVGWPTIHRRTAVVPPPSRPRPEACIVIDFTLSDENRLVRESARAFTEAEILPHIRDWDANGEAHREVFAKMAALGFLGAPVPEQYGGLGMDYISFALLCEELERADTAFRVVQSVHVGLNSLTLLQWGSEDQRQRWLVPQARGEKLATFGLTEPGVGTDAGSLESTARRDGESYVLNGHKIWISLADIADHFLVFASVDRERKHRGVTAFVVERGMPGLTTGTLHGKLGIRAGNTGLIDFENVRVPVENRIGEEGEGFLIAMSAIDQGRFTVAAGAVGLAQACLDASVRYAHERETFGEEIGRHQLVKQMIANMAKGTEIGRLLVFQAGWRKNQGLRNTQETSLAKWHATDHAVASALDAIQVHGANGYSNEFPVERYLRNPKGRVNYGGTSQLHA